MRKSICLLVTVVALVLVLSCSVQAVLGGDTISPSSASWSMFRQDPAHNGYATSDISANSAKLLWNYTTNRMVQSSPAVADGRVFVGSRDSEVYCLNASSGLPIWEYPVRYEVWSSPAVYDGRVYVGADSGYVYCLNMASGTLIWKTLIGAQVRSSPAVNDGVVYVGSDSNLCALNATSGNLVWELQNVDPLASSPAVFDDALYIGSGNGFIYAFNASTGGTIWRYPIRTSDSSSPAACNGYIYIGTYDGFILALNASTGTQEWRFQTADEVESSPAVAYGCVYIGSEDDNVYCLNASTGSKIWESPTGYWVTSSPAVSGNMVYVGSQDGGIYCFNAATGAKEWSYQTGNSVESSPAIANNTLYIGSDDCEIYAFSLTNSTLQPQPPQPTNSLQTSSIMFDALACAIGAGVIFAAAYYAYSDRRRQQNLESVDISGQGCSWFRRHTDAILVLTILAFSLIFFVNLGSGVLQVSDEQTYSQWAYHMLKTGDYLTPWAFGAISWDIGKPPLLMWLMSLAYQAFGVNNFSSRIWTAGFGALSLVIVFFLGKKLYNRPVGFVSAFVLGTFVTYYVFARYAMTDVPLTCFILGSIYFFVLSEEKKHSTRNAIISGLFFGLALMTKQLDALLIPLIIFAYLVATRKSLRFLFTKGFTFFWGVGLLLFSPWLIYMAARFGGQFWEWYFVYADLSRSTSTVEGHLAGYLFYFNYLACRENWVWLVLLPFAVGLCGFNAAVKRVRQDTLVLLWMAIVLIVFSLAQTKIYWYIMPVFPAFALAIASLLYHVWCRLNSYFAVA